MLDPITSKGAFVRGARDAIADVLARPSIRRTAPVPIEGDPLAWLDPLVQNLSRYREVVLATKLAGWCAVYDNKLAMASNASRLAQVLATRAVAFDTKPANLLFDLHDGATHTRAIQLMNGRPFQTGAPLPFERPGELTRELVVHYLGELGLFPFEPEFLDLAVPPLGIEVTWTDEEPDLVSRAALRERAPSRRTRR